MNVSMEQLKTIVEKLNHLQSVKDTYRNGLRDAIQRGDIKTTEYFNEVIRQVDEGINSILFCLGVLDVEVTVKECGGRGIVYKIHFF